MNTKYLNESKTYLKVAGILILPFLFIILFNFLAEDLLMQIDQAVSIFVYNLRNDSLTYIMRSITFIGDTWTQVVITIGFMLLMRLVFKLRQAPWWYGITALLGSYFLNQGLKVVFHRLRPDTVYHLVMQDGFSFPSGHAMGSMIMFGGMAFVLSFHVIKEEKIQIFMLLSFLILILLIGFSRIYLGVHYFSDVMGGFFAGASWLSLSISFYYRYYSGYRQRKKESKNDKI